MALFTSVSRRLVIGVVVCTLTLGGFLFQPAGALARNGTSGEHYQEATITSIELIALEPIPIPYPNDGPSWNWWCRSWWCR